MAEHEQQGSQDQQQEPKKRRSFLRRVFPVPKIRWRSDGVRVDDEWRNLQERASDIRHRCPHDGTPMDLDDVYPLGRNDEIEEGSEPYRALICPKCNYSIPVTNLIAQARKEVEPLRSAEKQHFVFGLIIAVGFGIVSGLNGNIFTLIAGLVAALMMMVRAMVFRYRRWQAIEGRMFEDSPPLSDWLRAEFQNNNN